MAVTCQADLTANERAIRHLVGERAAMNSRIHRLQAEDKLVAAKILAQPVKRPTKAPATPEFPHGGIFADVSSFQPHVDLAEVAKASSLIVVKATEALDYIDGYLASRWAGAKAAGIPHRGAYHFLHMDESGTAQGEYFLHALDAAGGVTAQDVVIADAEISSGAPAATVAQVVADFGAYVAAHCPAKRWLYTGGPFATEFGLKLVPFNGHWLPAYVGDPKPYYVFGTPIAWQHTDGVNGPTPHAVEGIGSCDMSIIL
jgi:GH25 family lysozyme M1 (1,4-beta-N-acetylmuramidase)